MFGLEKIKADIEKALQLSLLASVLEKDPYSVLELSRYVLEEAETFDYNSQRCRKCDDYPACKLISDALSTVQLKEYQRSRSN